MSTPQPDPRQEQEQEQEQVEYAPAVPESHPLRAEDVPALLDKRID